MVSPVGTIWSESSGCFVIAEAGVNHNGDVALAHRLVDAAVDAGADAVKFQTFTADRIVTPTAAKATYQAAATGGAETQHEMLRRLELDAAAHAELMEHCRARGILFLSTPFDEPAADLLARLGVEALKVPSGELTNLPFLDHVARKGLPLIVSTGMADLGEVEQAVRTVTGLDAAPPLALLHCVSSYPTPPADANLRAMATLRACFGVPVGFSDHTAGQSVAVAAAAIGARVIEKHLTLDRSMDGPDHKASLEPGEFTTMVAGIRDALAALGDGMKRPRPIEAEIRRVARKSLVAARALAAGTVLTAGDLVAKRPGTGIAPSGLAQVVGRRLRHDVAVDHQIAWGDLD